MPAGRRPVVAIIGGGYTGAAIAYHLDRLPGGSSATAVVVVEPRATLGAGLAYGTDDPACRINVPSSRMSIDPERPADFDDWLAETGEAAADTAALIDDGRRFPRRAAFGRYVADRLAPALAAGRILHRRAMVTRLELAGQGYRLTFGDRSSLEADLVVIATSHPPPSVPAVFAEALQGDPRLVRDATRPGALLGIHPDERILIVGTGLTMADVVASLDAAGHRGPFTAFSRRGQLSAVHPQSSAAAFGDFVSDPATTALGLLHRVRAAVRLAEARNIPQQAAFDALRAQGQGIWHALPVAERRRTVRHLRVFWDARRFRIAPQVHDVLERLAQGGRFTAFAARAVAVTGDADAITVTLSTKNTQLRPVACDRVVIATGPAHSALLDSAPFLAALSAAGLVTADAVGLGLATDTACRALARDGTPRDTLLIAGPLARGTFGELMGLPEVTGNAVATAGQIARWISERREEFKAARLRA